MRFTQIKIAILSTFLALPSFAAIDRFEISVDSDAIVNEAFDITVKALDELWEEVTDYTGEVFFYTDLPNEEADSELPTSYTFTTNDAGEHVFSKGFTFKKADTIELTVVELVGSAEWTVSIVVSDKVEVAPETFDISITSPNTNIEVQNDQIDIVGTTEPNRAVDIYLAGAKVLQTQSDNTGNFSAKITGLVDGENTIEAKAVNGDNTVAGTSPSIIVKKVDNSPAYESLKILEWNEVIAGSTITFEGKAEAWLKSFKLSINDANNSTVVLTEDPNGNGMYRGSYKASSFEWEYKVSVTIEDTLASVIEKTDAIAFRTIQPNITNVSTNNLEGASTEDVQITFSVAPDHDSIVWYQVSYGSSSWVYTKEMNMGAKASLKSGNVYQYELKDLEAGEYFAQIVALNSSGETIDSVTSDEFSFTVNLLAPTECSVGTVLGVSVETFDKHSVIRWNAVSNANKYQIYQKDASGNFTKVSETSGTEYTVNIDFSKSDEYADFAIKAVCNVADNGFEGVSPDLSSAVWVKTGPAMIMILLLLLSASSFAAIAMRRWLVK